jgi:hypothetical protein
MSPAYDWRVAADYGRRAVEHRPANPEQLRIAARRLQQTGLKPGDIAAALGLRACSRVPRDRRMNDHGGCTLH